MVNICSLPLLQDSRTWSKEVEPDQKNAIDELSHNTALQITGRITKLNAEDSDQCYTIICRGESWRETSNQ